MSDAVTPTAAYRIAVRDAGYSPVACRSGSKIPALEAWQTKRHPSDEEINSWPAGNTGIQNFDTAGVDIDITHEEAAVAVEEMFRDHFDGQGTISPRIGLAPKRSILLRVDVPFKIMEQYYRAPNGDIHHIEIRGDGQQTVIQGKHPDTGKDYIFVGKAPPELRRGDLPLTTGAELRGLLDRATALLEREFGYQSTDRPETKNNGHDASPAIPPADGRVDYVEQLISAERGGINKAQSRRILSLLNRGEHPDDIERTVLDETLASKGWDARTWTEKKEIARHIRPIIRSGLKKLNNEYKPDVAAIPGWLHENFHVEWCRITAAGGHPALVRPGHACKVIDTKPRPAGDNARAIPLTMSEWLARKFPPRDELMGAWITTTSRLLLSADTGLGKTSLVLAIMVGMAAGCRFLHWGCQRPSRVLLIDGEMAGEWLQVMLQDAKRRIGLVTDNLCCLSAEDYPGMPPLNTKDGFAFLRGYIEEHGPFDFIGFDNIMSLSIGNPKDPEAWQGMLELIAYLSRARVGQLWVNHTGHDTTRGYGDKAKGWRMTSILHMDKVERPDTDVSFELKFVKARERNPSNRADFQPVKVALVRDKWICSVVGRTRSVPKDGTAGDNILRVLKELIAGDQAIETDGDRRVVPIVLWRDVCVSRGHCKGSSVKSMQTCFYDEKTKLTNTANVECDGDLVWPV